MRPRQFFWAGVLQVNAVLTAGESLAPFFRKYCVSSSMLAVGIFTLSTDNLLAVGSVMLTLGSADCFWSISD